jgi:hypothetical protein
MSQGGPNARRLAALAAANEWAFSGDDAGWTLQHRHPDGDRWLVIGHFPTKRLAQEAGKAFAAAGHGPEGDFRVRRAKAPAD